MKKNVSLLILSLILIIIVIVQLYNQYLSYKISKIENDNSGIKFSIITHGGRCEGLCGEEKTIITKDSIISYYKSHNGKIKNYKEKPMDSKKWEKLIQSLDLKALESVVFPINCRSCSDHLDIDLIILYEGKSLYIDYDALPGEKNLFGEKENKNKVIQFLHAFQLIYTEKYFGIIGNNKNITNRETIDCPEGVKEILGNVNPYIECSNTINKNQLIYQNESIKKIIRVQYIAFNKINFPIIKEKYVFEDNIGNLLLLDEEIDYIYNFLRGKFIHEGFNIDCDIKSSTYNKCKKISYITEEDILENNNLFMIGNGKICVTFNFKNDINGYISICDSNGITEKKLKRMSISNQGYIECTISNGNRMCVESIVAKELGLLNHNKNSITEINNEFENINYNTIKNLIPDSVTEYNKIIGSLDFIKSNPDKLEENKLLGKEILQIIKDTSIISNNDKIIIKTQLEKFIYGTKK